MAAVYCSGWGSRFYTVEARRRVGYDRNLPAEGVILHKIDLTRADRQSQVVDADNNGDPNDAGATWTPGRAFHDPEFGITISVVSETTSGYEVTIANDGRPADLSLVTTPADCGPGSLREAIHWANQFPGTKIVFRCPAAPDGPITIAPKSLLPWISGKRTTLGATTQTGWSGAPMVALSGRQAGAGATGVRIMGTGCAVRGLRIGGWAVGRKTASKSICRKLPPAASNCVGSERTIRETRQSRTADPGSSSMAARMTISSAAQMSVT